MRLLEPETGSIQINGDQASSIPEIIQKYRSGTSQNLAFLGNIKENLTLGYEDFNDDEISEALQILGLIF